MLTQSSTDATPDIRRIRALLSGIVFECPIGGNPTDCICHNIRLLPPGKRFQWIKQLSDKECLEVYRNHMLCYTRKAKDRGLLNAEATTVYPIYVLPLATQELLLVRAASEQELEP